MVRDFRVVTLRDGHSQLIPADVEITEPTDNPVPRERLHLLAHIPWHRRYLKLIPEDYRDFFEYLLPHLAQRTTNVHTALSVAFVPYLHKHIAPQSNLKLALIGTMVHDCGWSKVTPTAIADSLDYSGIIFTPNAAEAKLQHTVFGGQLAPELVRAYPGQLGLTDEEISYIGDIPRWHEYPERYKPGQPIPPELLITCEADRLWPFTHQNFWLDTMRKGVDPVEYITNVKNSIDDLFLTPVGRHMASVLYAHRTEEVRAYREAMQSHAYQALSHGLVSAHT